MNPRCQRALTLLTFESKSNHPADGQFLYICHFQNHKKIDPFWWVHIIQNKTGGWFCSSHFKKIHELLEVPLLPYFHKSLQPITWMNKPCLQVAEDQTTVHSSKAHHHLWMKLHGFNYYISCMLSTFSECSWTSHQLSLIHRVVTLLSVFG